MFSLSSSVVSFHQCHLLDVASMMDNGCVVAPWCQRHGTSNNSRAVQQYCCDFGVCSDSLVPCSAWTECFAITATLLHWQRWDSSICKASLLHEAVSKGCKLAMLPFAPWLHTHLSPAESQRGYRGAVHGKGPSCAGAESTLGMGKAGSALVLLNFSVGSKACGNSNSSSFPSGIRLAGKLKSYWSLFQKVQWCQESCNIFSSFWIEVMKEWNAFLLWEES